MVKQPSWKSADESLHEEQSRSTGRRSDDKMAFDNPTLGHSRACNEFCKKGIYFYCTRTLCLPTPSLANLGRNLPLLESTFKGININDHSSDLS